MPIRLTNRRAWDRLSPELRVIVGTNFNEVALGQRDDMARLNASLSQQLFARGLISNDPDPESFRLALRKAGYDKDCRTQYGSKGWSLLEKYAGNLA